MQDLSHYEKIAFVASPRDEAQDALVKLRHKYGAFPEASANIIVALGGDGLMLEVLRLSLIHI